MERAHGFGFVRQGLRVALLSLGLLSVLTVGSVAGAQESDEREVEVDIQLDKAVVKSESKAADREDELEFQFDNGSHTFEFKYESEREASEFEAEINVDLFDLIEWRDMNGNGQYDPDVAGETVQRIGLGDLAPVSIAREDIQVDGIPGVKLVGVSSAPDKYPDLVLTLTLYMFGDFLEMGQTELEPTAMKFDIQIEGFPYEEEDTSLALGAKMSIGVEGETEGASQEGEESIGARMGSYAAFFDWDPNVTVDGQPGTVGHSMVKHEVKTEQKQEAGEEKWETKVTSELYLLYPRGDLILHDPQIGVRLPAQANGGGGCTFSRN